MVKIYHLNFENKVKNSIIYTMDSNLFSFLTFVENYENGLDLNKTPEKIINTQTQNAIELTKQLILENSLENLIKGYHRFDFSKNLNKNQFEIKLNKSSISTINQLHIYYENIFPCKQQVLGFIYRNYFREFRNFLKNENSHFQSKDKVFSRVFKENDLKLMEIIKKINKNHKNKLIIYSSSSFNSWNVDYH